MGRHGKADSGCAPELELHLDADNSPIVPNPHRSTCPIIGGSRHANAPVSSATAPVTSDVARTPGQQPGACRIPPALPIQLNLYGALALHRWADQVQVGARLHYPIDPSAVTLTLSSSGMQAARDRVCQVADREQADDVYPVPGDHCDNCPWQLRCPAR